MEARDPLTSIRCEIGAQTIHASCDRDSVVNLVVAAGVLAVPGSTKQTPIRGLRVMLTGVRDVSKTACETLEWFDSVVPDRTAVRARWPALPSATEPARRRIPTEPAAVDQFLSRRLNELEHYCATEAEEADSPLTVTPEVSSDVSVDLPISDYCLAVRRNDVLVSVIGTRWSSSVTITLDRTRDEPATCQLKLAGFDGAVQFSWGELPLAPLDEVEICLIGRAQPQPARVAGGIGQSAAELAKAFRDELRKRYRK